MSKKTKHKFAGFHLWKEVCSVISENKEYAEEQCEKKLLDYFHKKTEGLTLFPLSFELSSFIILLLLLLLLFIYSSISFVK